MIGDEADLGVENLCGSGTIAGETARAYTDIFTLGSFFGRAVGIGAASATRTPHHSVSSNAPIILTGHQALNKLLAGRSHRTNSLEGRTSVIPTAFAHTVSLDPVAASATAHRASLFSSSPTPRSGSVQNHMESVRAAVEWLGFVPARRHAPLPVVDVANRHH